VNRRETVVTRREWVIAGLVDGFRLLDAWALPAAGGRDDFGALVDLMAGFDPADAESAAVRVLFAVRERLGSLFGWDDATEPRAIPGRRETTLAERLPSDLRGTATQPVASDALWSAGFRPLYRTSDEWAAEISNETVHGVLHLAWVDAGGGRYRGQMRIYVKPRGLLGRLYLLAIQPFRHLVVYPALLRQIERRWKTGT
jgi:hypothetical protein